MPDVERRYHPARLVARAEAGGSLTRVTLAVSLEALRSYTAPGQYVEVRAGDECGFFVLASEPGAPAWELVMRSGGGVSDVLLAAPPSTDFEVTPAMGAGFPMDSVRGLSLVVAVVGTGVAAARPVVSRRTRDGDAAKTRLLIGLRSQGELPYRAELAGWMRAGVDVLACLSQEREGAEPTGPVPFARGRVPEVLRRRGSPVQHVFAVGPPSLVDALKELAREWGTSPEDVRTNY